MDSDLRPMAFVHSSRTEPTDDGWDAETVWLELADWLPDEALDGIEGFSHIELIHRFHKVDRVFIAEIRLIVAATIEAWAVFLVLHSMVFKDLNAPDVLVNHIYLNGMVTVMPFIVAAQIIAARGRNGGPARSSGAPHA